MRQRVVLLSFVVLAAFFVATVALARTYEARKSALVREWAQEGDAALAAGNPGLAVEDFRNALAYDPENGPVQLHLAQSLLSGGRLQEARTYFLNLWEITPGSGILNLDLARTSAALALSDQAVLYYRTAILGGWDQQPETQRQHVRIELCQYLIAHGRAREAEAEIAGLATDASPEDAQAHIQAGDLFMKVDAPARALTEYALALKAKPDDAGVVEEAAKAAYESGDYAQAEKYLSKAMRDNPSDAIREMQGTVRQVQYGDPFLPGLSEVDKEQRSQAAYEQALMRLQSCQNSAPGGQSNAAAELADIAKQVSELKPTVTPRSLQSDPQFEHQVMHLVFRIEDVTERTCGTPTGMDQALILIGKRHAQSEQ